MENKPLWLALPYPVRWKIYSYLGFQYMIAIDMNTGMCEEDEPIGAWSSRNQCFHEYVGYVVRCDAGGYACPGGSRCYPLCNQLFYVSRAVSLDARSVFYFNNAFRVSDRCYRGLSPLMNLGPIALESLCQILVQLDTTWCLGSFAGSFCHGEVTYRALEKASLDPKKQEAFSHWAIFCERLATRIPPSQLELVFLCGVSDLRNAERILNPLLDLPTLKHCSIRLAPRRGCALQSLVERIVEQTTKRARTTTKPAFPFSELPSEIQLQVLSHTDLAAPSALTWTWKPCRGFMLEKCENSTCSAHPKGADSTFCPSTHIAYSSVYTCWRMPVSLFQVNRQIRDQANLIFYSQNKFHLWIDPPYSYEPGKPHFIAPFPEECVEHLRHVKWSFGGSVEDQCLLPGGQRYPAWIETLDLISQNTPLHRLSLSLDFTYEAMHILCEQMTWNYDFEEMGKRKWSYYQKIIQPMTRVKGLKDLFIYLSWPPEFEKASIRYDMERQLEKMVMGKDYDSLSRGKELTTFP